MKLARRYQVLAAVGWCEACGVSVPATDDDTAEKQAALHAKGEGHQVRVVQSRLVIIAPQPAPAEQPATQNEKTA